MRGKKSKTEKEKEGSKEGKREEKRGKQRGKNRNAEGNSKKRPSFGRPLVGENGSSTFCVLFCFFVLGTVIFLTDFRREFSLVILVKFALKF